MYVKEFLLHKSRVLWVFTFLIFLIISFFSATDFYVDYLMRGQKVSFWIELAWKISWWMPWFFLLPLLFKVKDKFTIQPGNLGTGLLTNLLLCIPIISFKITVYFVMSLPLRTTVTPTFFLPSFQSVFLAHYHLDFVVYLCIMVFKYGLDYYIHAQEQKIHAHQLEARLANARLQVLHMQLQPHFFFNTLHNISALIHIDVDRADQMITRLCDLLRVTFEQSTVHKVPLTEEKEFIENYLLIVSMRFEDRLDVELNFSEYTIHYLVPVLILQPIVENAIKHAVAPFSRKSCIKVRSYLKDNDLVLEIEDNGPGIKISKKTAMKKGVGLSNTIERLDQLYKNNYSLELINQPQGGLIVRLVLPCELTQKV